jgi:hypothetical protein
MNVDQEGLEGVLCVECACNLTIGGGGCVGVWINP